MNKFKAILFGGIFFGLLIAGYFSYQNYFKNSFPSEAKAPPGSIDFSVSTEDMEIECFTLYYPITNITKISLKKTSVLSLSNGQNKSIICDIILDHQRYPLFWTHNIKDLDQKDLETRAVFLGKQTLVVDKILFNSEKKMFLASAPNQSSVNKMVDYEGTWKFNLLPPSVPEDDSICFNCDSMIQTTEFYLNSFVLPLEKDYATQIVNLWHSKENFLNCGKVSGVSVQTLNKFLSSPIPDTLDFKEYPWDIPEGWKDPTAKTLYPVLDCFFNEAIENWQCSKNTKNESLTIAPSGTLCKNLPINLQDQCFLDYFSNEIYPQNNRCLNRVFTNLGHQPSILKFNHPTAKGLTLSQRGLILDENTISLRFEQVMIQPISQKQGYPIPCLTLIESSGAFSKVGKDLLFFMQSRYVNLDHKQFCKKAKHVYKDIKTIFKATHDEKK